MTTKHHLAREAPYSDTRIPYGQTKNDIDEMLKEAGAMAIRWTETPDSMKGVGLPILEFIMPFTLRGVETKIGIRLEPRLTQKSQRRDRYRGPVINVPNRNGSMRLLYWYLQARLNAIRHGLEDTVTSFMAHIINQLPDGTVTTFGDTVKEHPEVIRELLPSFEIIPKKQLEVKALGTTAMPKEEEEIIEAESTET